MTDFTDQLLLWEHDHPTTFRALWFSPDGAACLGPAARDDVTRLRDTGRLNRLGSAAEVFDLDLYYPASVYRIAADRPSMRTVIASSHETHLG